MFVTYPPSTILRPYVAFYYVMKCCKKDYKDTISEFCLPSGFCHMVFHSCGSFDIIQDNKKQKLPKFYTVGQQTQRYYLNSDFDFVDLIGVTFKPTGLWHFFGMDMSTVTDKVISTTSLFGGKIKKFTGQFDFNQELDARIELIENLLIDELLTVQPQLKVIDSAVQRIHETYGCCSITELVNYLGISERYFQKNFKKMIGITPNAYKRIVRFNFMFSETKKDAPLDCQTLSALCNYYDLAHFSKDFKKYCGVCPSQFHMNELDLFQELMASKAFVSKAVENSSYN